MEVLPMNKTRVSFCLTPLLFAAWYLAPAQAPDGSTAPPPIAPAWSQPGSPTHVQIPPPPDFHRPSKNFQTPIGIFQGQSDIGSALVPGSAKYDAGAGQYSIDSAGYNVWYTRDEFHYLWSKSSGDLSLAADVSFPDPKGFNDRMILLIVRQDLDDDSKEAFVAVHGNSMAQLAERPEKAASVTATDYRITYRAKPISPKRIGIEKLGNSLTLFVSLTGEPMHQFGPPIDLHFDGPFYVGIGFCSHQPVTSDTGVLSNVLFKHSAGKIH
jgi:hypothetical protein